MDNVNSDALRADHLLGHENLNTDGSLHLAGSLDERDLYDALNDLIYRDGTTALNNLPDRAGNFNLLDSLCAVGPPSCALDNLLDGVKDTSLDNTLDMMTDAVWISNVCKLLEGQDLSQRTASGRASTQR